MIKLDKRKVSEKIDENYVGDNTSIQNTQAKKS